MEQFFYHVTTKENARKILQEGLKANEQGEIFLFENKSFTCSGVAENGKGGLSVGIVMYYVADYIVKTQVGLDNNVMLEISAEGLNVELEADNVAEACSRFQWIAKQPIIEAKYIEPFCIVRPKRFGELMKEFRELTDEEVKMHDYGK